MGLIHALGCASIAFGPHLVLFLSLIARDSLKVTIFIVSAFFWILSLLLSSLIWFILVPLKSYLIIGVVCSVFCQEAVRYYQFDIYKRFNRFLQSILSPNSHSSDDFSVLFSMDTNKSGTLALVSGCGFGTVYAMFAFSNLLTASYGPGIMNLHSVREYFFVNSAVFTLLFGLMHISWSIIMSEANLRKSYKAVVFVVSTHLIASTATFANQYQYYGTSFGAVIVTFILVQLYAFRLAGADLTKMRQAFSHTSITNTETTTIND